MRVELLVGDLDRLIRVQRIRTILDIGAGHAPVTLLLLAKHPRLSATLADPSPKLLANARRLQKELGINPERVQTVKGNLSFVRRGPARFTSDLIICHAVANWTPRPLQFVKDLAVFARGHARYLSLVVGSSPAKAIRFATLGKLRSVEISALHPGELTRSLIGENKVRPLHPDAVIAALTRRREKMIFRAGIRVFADYLPAFAMKTPVGYRSALGLERKVRQHPDWWKFGQLVHIITKMPPLKTV